MSSRLAEIAAHLETTRELGMVIGAMRSIAASRVREAREQVEGVRAYAGTLGHAIGEALALLPEPPHAHEDDSPALLLAICSEQGFVGAYNERLLDLLRQQRQPQDELLLVGERGLMVAAEQDLQVDWSAPMVMHADELPGLAGQAAEAIYQRLVDSPARRVLLVHAQSAPPGEHGPLLLCRPLLPFDYSRFPQARHTRPPRLNLAAGSLLAGLAEEYVYAELCEALMLAFAAENEARMQAMVAAQSNVEERRAQLTQDFRHARQDEITDEIIELSGQSLQRG